MRGLGITEHESQIYFLKEQKSEFFKILAELVRTDKEIKRIYTLEKLKSYIDNDVQFSLIRYPNPLNFKR